MRVALGFRAHSGWAAVVAVAGTLDEPQILDRSRIVIADPEMPGSRQPYHAAAGLTHAQAEQRIHSAIESSRGLACEAISAVAKRLHSQGHEVTACGVIAGSGKKLPELVKILGSHPLLHTAEGVLFRDALLWAAKEGGFSVQAVPEKSLTVASLERIGSLGKLIGPPWTQDQKLATLAGLIALASS